MSAQHRGLWKPLLFGVVAAGVLAPNTAAQAAPSAAALEDRIRTSAVRLEKVVEQYNKINDDLGRSQTAAKALRGRLAPMQAQVDLANARVARIAVAAYQGASLAQFSAVLSAPDTAIVVDRLITISQISAYENTQMAAVLDAKARQDVAVARLAALIADEQAKRATLVAQKKKINADLAALYALRRKVYGTVANQAPSGAGTPAPYVAGKAGVAVRYAYAALGKPYAWGSAGPGSYDCSGLTMAAWRAAGVSLSHNAASQWSEVSHLSRGALKPGDLVFYSGLGHVGLYVGNGRIIHAPSFGDVVRIASVDVMAPYGYGRPHT